MAALVLAPDVGGHGVEHVLVCIGAVHAAELLEMQDALEGLGLELGKRQVGGGGAGVRRLCAACGPGGLVGLADGCDEQVEEVRGSLLDAQDGHDELLGLGEEQLVFGVDVVYVCEVRVVV